jgi:hypothetical protein
MPYRPQHIGYGIRLLAPFRFEPLFVRPMDRASSSQCVDVPRPATLVGADAISFDAHGARFVEDHADLFSPFKLLTWDLDVNSATRDFATKLPLLNRFSAFQTVFPSSFSY